MTTKYRGVSQVGWRYRARLCYNGKKLHLGYYDTPEDAARAWDKKAIELFGLWIKLNFPLKENDERS